MSDSIKFDIDSYSKRELTDPDGPTQWIDLAVAQEEFGFIVGNHKMIGAKLELDDEQVIAAIRTLTKWTIRASAIKSAKEDGYLSWRKTTPIFPRWWILKFLEKERVKKYKEIFEELEEKFGSITITDNNI